MRYPYSCHDALQYPNYSPEYHVPTCAGVAPFDSKGATVNPVWSASRMVLDVWAVFNICNAMRSPAYSVSYCVPHVAKQITTNHVFHV